MNVLMYPIAPEDDFPDEFCAIRQGSGEHWFYTPAGEDASWMLFRAESENARLREQIHWLKWLNAKIAGHEPLTPEQAIAATLGTTDARPTQAESSGTCKLDDFADVPFSVDYKIEGYDMGSCRDYATLAECSACGAYIIVPPEYHHVLTCDGDEVYQPYRFCPCCGKKVVEPTTNDVDAEATNG